jgi:hypothetical protein
MAHRSKHVRGEHVSSWLEEDGCGAVFARDEDSDDEYLLIQRHFEEPDDGRPYIETDDAHFSGHFRGVAATLDRDRLEISYGSKTVSVSFAISAESFEGLAKALRVLIPNLQVGGGNQSVRHNGG